jgi:hypothetical protein
VRKYKKTTIDAVLKGLGTNKNKPKKGFVPGSKS